MNYPDMNLEGKVLAKEERSFMGPITDEEDHALEDPYDWINKPISKINTHRNRLGPKWSDDYVLIYHLLCFAYL